MISEICVVMQWNIIQIFILQSIVINCSALIFQDLPQIDLDSKTALDIDISYQELTAALGQLNSGKSPGIDGLRLEFYKKNCYCIGKDLCFFLYVTKMVCCLCPFNVLFCHCCLKRGSVSFEKLETSRSRY